MQLIVLGMHRSGTSAVCRILNMMGAYFGPEGSSTGFSIQNPKGFWERKDIRKMNDSALFAAKADWYKVADFNCTIVSDRIKEVYTKTAKGLVHELDAHRPWVIKEPRLCLLLPLLLPVLEVPVCIHVYRNPLQVAQSLKTRNGFPLSVGTALWEKYTLSALSSTRGLSNVLISYRRLIEKPVETVQNLFEELVSMGIQRLNCPIDKEINAFIDPSLFRERGDPNLMKKEYLNTAQIELFRSLENNSVFNYKKIPTLSAGALDVLRSFEAQDEKFNGLQKTIGIKEMEFVKKSESRNIELDARNQLLKEKETEADNLNEKLYVHENERLINWMRKLNNGFQALMASRRWRVDNAIGRSFGGILLRSKKPMVVDPIRKIFMQFEKTNQLAAGYNKFPAPQNDHDRERLIIWMKQLQNDFSALMTSRRWRWGNAAIRSIEIMLFRSRVRLAPDYMQEIFTEFENWKQNSFCGRPISSLSYGEINQLLTWMRKLNNNFQAMMASRRWRVGNAMGRFFNCLLFQPRTPMVTDHMQKILEDYRNLFQK